MRTYLFFALGLALVSIKALAEVTRNVKIESEPSGAKVLLIEGDLQTPVGVTPFHYTAEFHSEMSVSRLLFQKSGYTPKQIDLSASDSHIKANLEKSSLFKNAPRNKTDGSDATLTKVRQILDETLPKITSQGNGDFEIVAAEIKNEGTALTVDVSLLLQANRPSSEDKSSLPKSIWDLLPKKNLVEVLDRLGKINDIKGFRIAVSTNDPIYAFSVKSHMDTEYKNECVSGTRQVYDNCARYVSAYTGAPAKCVAGYRTVMDPCASTRTLAKNVLKLTPEAGAKAGNTIVRFTIPENILRSPKHLSFSNIVVENLLNSTGIGP